MSEKAMGIAHWKWRCKILDLTKFCKNQLAYNKVLHFAPSMKK
jgi:hypothetical protein